MTVTGLVLSTLIATILFGSFKFVVFGLLGGSMAVLVVFWVILLAITTAVVRRLGILNFAEAILLVIVWLLFSILLDAILISSISGGGLLLNWNYWITQLVVSLGILLFHKKVHTKIALSKYS